MTTQDPTVPDKLFENFLHRLVGRFFKIMPLKESNSPTLNLYLQSFKIDLMGCNSVMKATGYNDLFLQLIDVLQFFLEHDFDNDTCHREVMKCIGIVKLLYEDYAGKPWSKHQ